MFDDPGDIDHNGIPDSIQSDPVLVPADSPAFGEPAPDLGLGLSGMVSPIEPPVAPTLPPEGADEATMLEYQQQMQKHTQAMQMLTNLQQMEHETRKAIVQNFRG